MARGILVKIRILIYRKWLKDGAERIVHQAVEIVLFGVVLVRNFEL